MYTVRLRASCLNVSESIANAGMRNGFGIMQLLGKPGEKRKHCKVSVKGLGARRQESVCFPLVSQGIPTVQRKTHMEQHSGLGSIGCC